MSNKISSETKTAVLNLFKDGESQAEIAEKCGISRRSVGRIIDNGKKGNEDKSIKTTTTKTAEKPMEKNFDGLLPCPFCGGDARIKSDKLPTEHCDYEMSYYVECSKCHLMTTSVFTGLREWYKDKNHKEISTAEAVERVTRIWNNRFDSNKKGAFSND